MTNRIKFAILSSMKINCPYFGKCGGCRYLDLEPDAYEKLKRAQIEQALSFMHLDIPIQRFIRLPSGIRRRASFAFYKGHLGFNERKSHQIIDLDNCPMLTPALNALIPALKKLVYDLKGNGDVFLLETPYGIDMHIKMGKTIATLQQLELLVDFGQKNPVARLLFNNDPILEKTPLPFPPDVFLQPSVAGEEILIQLVKDALTTEKKGLDLFCGTGTFTKPLLETGIHMIGYDSEKQAVQALGKNGIVRDLFRNPLLPAELNDADFVVMDPPRAGAKAQTEQLAQSNVKKIILISCNPATAARDLRILIDAGYQVSSLTAVDQFAYTDHIEICIILKNKYL